MWQEFTVMTVSPSGQALCVGSYDRMRLYSWSARKNLWEENASKEFRHLYSITALAWKRDGSRWAQLVLESEDFPNPFRYYKPADSCLTGSRPARSAEGWSCSSPC